MCIVNIKTHVMRIHKEIRIDKPIADCWIILGKGYPEISRWASAIKKSTGSGNGINGSPCSERDCVNGNTTLTEKLVKFDEKNRLLSYDIVKGTPPFVRHANNTWQLIDNGNDTTLRMTLVVTTKGIAGPLLGAVMKTAMSKMFSNMLEEFRHYVEEGKAHRRKAAAMEEQ